ncbi:Gfo/Idh/MocA family protein [Tunicatimonas pelagia]|uniref:Gfo/Idh/MocA family protein n=1 Tax=Tunicatimonas pelagia TaxID=931531 RepID=UPI0026654042|nr:Gfo/Idh/MocA family oxidoreductase [Tunicatimonas pelagia]WKN45835.1 Gfo/Idh/MocA family oxidoreductase [Tunicatimonas pelagia]
MKKSTYYPTRRKFVKRISQGTGAGLFLSASMSLLGSACSSPNQSSETTSEASAAPARKDQLGLALVGLGSYSNGQLAPALKQTEKCYLAGIVTGTPSKAQEWKQKYNIPEGNIYNYDNYDELVNNDDIDIIYVVLPNSMHAEYTIRAAKAGKHVMCEKPMAVSVDECQQMIDACHKNNVKLAVGYRLHYEPFNQEIMRLAEEQVFGSLTGIQNNFGFTIGDPTQWRLDYELAGGGALMDVGIYTIQAACYTSGEEPISVVAKEFKTDTEKFSEVDETIHFTLTFPSGLKAECKTSYNQNYNLLRAEAENGWFQLDPAYHYGPLIGETSKGAMDFPQIREQAVHMDRFAECIMQDEAIKTTGEMGMRDMKIIEAIYQSIEENGREVALAL